ncbi:hypothetical protein RSOLAG1IB_12521 [Rhizoctonia solani AG-1 IB]|uniref:Uncharacterized protein n=1 Tax=Thanatephorus cucumeris (strain AG1-IB / isolate 7/3/14) TaxID=1108050 RepID=A0A0B7FWY2_THACB|nr:hypothetical protein RSOLAG1IB_12521 [Rhizoctonia solani AG-1 IB]
MGLIPEVGFVVFSLVVIGALMKKENSENKRETPKESKEPPKKPSKKHPKENSSVVAKQQYIGPRNQRLKNKK